MIERRKFLLCLLIIASNWIQAGGDRQLLQYAAIPIWQEQKFGFNLLDDADSGFTQEADNQLTAEAQPGTLAAATTTGPPPLPACQSLKKQNLPKFTLTQSDFDPGTKIISEPGYYTLASDIVFNPNSAEALGVEPYFASDVLPQQFRFYDPEAYGIGFFAAISLTTDNVTIDLNGFTLRQGEEHALNQRFFFLIELAAAPFVGGQGPHFFGKPIFTAKNVCIKNGILGLSAHNAIHGNNNQNVEIRDLMIQNYEVGAIQINKGTDVLVENIEVPFVRTDVPIRGRFSAARFIRPWINKLVDSGYTDTLSVGGKKLTALEIQTELRNAINDATNQVLKFGKIKGDLEPLFGNPGGLPDGSIIYGILTNFLGIAVNGLPQDVPPEARSRRVTIRNFRITALEIKVRETPGLTDLPPDTPDRSKREPATDAVGAMLETQDGFTTTPEGVYVGNPVANAQLLVAKAINQNFTFNFGPERRQITPNIVAWAESGRPYKNFGLTYMCNGDIMFHVNKGPIAFKLDSTDELTCDKCRVYYVKNEGDIGSTICNDDIPYRDGTGTSSPLATQTGYNGGDARGFTVSSSSNVVLRKPVTKYVLARAGDAYGIDVAFGSENVRIVKPVVKKIQAGYGYFPFQYKSNPTHQPKSAKINIDESTSNVEVKRGFVVDKSGA